MTWKTKIQQQSNKDVIKQIALELEKHSDNNIVNYEQLKKIQDLAKDVERLQSVLRLL